jgi:hypothetical protein
MTDPASASRRSQFSTRPTNSRDAGQCVPQFVKESGAPIEIVYDQGIPTETTNYTVIINNINNTIRTR